MSRLFHWVTAALLLTTTVAEARDLFVGTGCNYTSIPVALAAASDGDRVLVAAATINRHLSITKSVALIGTDVCGDSNPPPRSDPWVTIDGSGGSDQPTLTITGTHDVAISGFEFTRGHAGANGSGGGINYAGSGGALTLSNVVFSLNTAFRGGGLAITPAGSTVPDIYLKDDVKFLLNTSSDAGGGMYVGGHSEVFVMGRGDLFLLNTAGAAGGGIFVLGPAHIALGSPGANGLLLSQNKAQNGGGIAAMQAEYTGTSDEQLISLFATDAHSPGAITNNQATVRGGGIYLRGKADYPVGVADAALCAQDFIIDQNYAPEGAAVHLDVATSADEVGFASGYFNTSNCRSASTFGAVHCAAGVHCNTISSNEAMDANFHPTAGSTVVVSEGGKFAAARVQMRDNQGEHLLLVADHGNFTPTIDLSACVIGGNHTNRELIRLEGSKNVLSIKQCTFAPDVIDASYVITFDNPLGDNSSITLLDTIIDEPGTLTLNYPGVLDSGDSGRFNMAYLLSNDITTLLSGPNIVRGTPLFVDGDNADPLKRDYHLRAYLQSGHVVASPGIDFAPSTGGTDLDGQNFDQDVPAVPDFAGTHDLGAYEGQPIKDRVFGDAFGDPTSLLR